MSDFARAVADDCTLQINRLTTSDLIADADRRAGRCFMSQAHHFAQLARRRAESVAAIARLPACAAEPCAFCYAPQPTESLRTLMLADSPASLARGVAKHPRGSDVEQTASSSVFPRGQDKSLYTFSSRHLQGASNIQLSHLHPESFSPVAPWNASVALTVEKPVQQCAQVEQNSSSRDLVVRVVNRTGEIRASGSDEVSSSRKNQPLSCVKHDSSVLGSKAGYALGFPVPSEAEAADWQAYAVEQLTVMNFPVPARYDRRRVQPPVPSESANESAQNLSSGCPELLSDCVRNGVLLCSLIEFALSEGVLLKVPTDTNALALCGPRRHAVSPIGHTHCLDFIWSPKTVLEAEQNFRVALHYLRYISRELLHSEIVSESSQQLRQATAAAIGTASTGPAAVSADEAGDASFQSGASGGIVDASGNDMSTDNVTQSTSPRHRIRGTIPFPPGLLHLDVKKVCQGIRLHELWGAVALVIHNLVALRHFRNGLDRQRPGEVGTTPPPSGFFFRTIPLAAVNAPAFTITTPKPSHFPFQCIPPLFLREACAGSKSSVERVRYTPMQWMLLEAAVCLYLFEQNVIPRVTAHSDVTADRRVAAAVPPSAGYVPHLKGLQVGGATRCPGSITCEEVMPFIRNGTLLCDLVVLVLKAVCNREDAAEQRTKAVCYTRRVSREDVRLRIHRNPRIFSLCAANVEAAQAALRKLPSSMISHTQLLDSAPILHGDRAFILLLVEDLMRLHYASSPRGNHGCSKRRACVSGNAGPVESPSRSDAHSAPTVVFQDPTRSDGISPELQGPFIPPLVAESLRGAYFNTAHPVRDSLSDVEGGTFPRERISEDLVAFDANQRFLRGELKHVGRPIAQQGHEIGDGSATMHHMFSQSTGNIRPSISDRGVTTTQAFTREGSVGPVAAKRSAFTTTHNATESLTAVVRPRLATVTNAISSGRSVAPQDEQRDLQDDSSNEADTEAETLPTHLQYLTHIPAFTDEELKHLVAWVHEKLGPTFVHKGHDFVFALSDFRTMTNPCFLFCDGVVLFELVSTLTYRDLDVKINMKPRAATAKRNNIRKVLNWLLANKKLVKDAPFIEEALVDGHVLAVIHILRLLQGAFRSHRGTRKH